MASHKDSSRVENESYEKFLINLVNEHGLQYFPSFFCNGKKRVIPKDLDKLNPQQFIELIKFMFQGYTTAKLSAALSKEDNVRAPLSNFAELMPGARLAYEAKPAALYQALKDIFPEDSDILLPCVILKPAADPQRTRKALKYLCRLLLFVDSIGEDLTDVREEVAAQAKEKDEIKNQIEGTTIEINSRTIDLDMWKGEVAVLEKQSLYKKEEIQALSVQTAKLEEEVKRAEREYNKLEEKNRSTQRAVAATTKEIESLKKKVVHNEDNIVHEYHSELTTLQELARQREVLGQQIEECRKNSEKVGEVTAASVTCISELGDMVQLMDELSVMHTKIQCAKTQKEEKAQAIRELEKKLKEKQDRCTVSAPQEALDAYRAESQRLEICDKELQDYKLQAENLTNEHNCLGGQMRKETNLRPIQRTQITKLNERIQIGEEYVREEVPAVSARLHETIQQTLDDLEDSFEAV